MAKPVTPGSAADLGERMILAPVALNPDLDERAVRVLARQFADGDQDGDGVAETEPVNVVVLVNKYDGVNLPAGACRLLILDGVPRPLDRVERREAVALADSTVRLAREVQRIEQGMGRGVRDGEDYCAVLLLGAKLATAIHEVRHLALFSPATQAQLRAGTSPARSGARGSTRSSRRCGPAWGGCRSGGSQPAGAGGGALRRARDGAGRGRGAT